jgi:hypothetical protein
VIFTTVFALFGKAAPDLWLVVARAGAVMAVVMVFKVAARITFWLTARQEEKIGFANRAVLPTVLAALIAAVSLVVSRGFISDNALGYSEGLMTALVLIAIERHIDHRPRQAFVVGFFAALDRPELWLFWGAYGLYLWWKDPAARKLVIGLFALIPVLWFLPEYWGSGHFFRGVSRAHNPRSNSPAFAKCPFCTEFTKHAWAAVLRRVKVVAVITMAAAAAAFVLRRRSGRPFDIRSRAQLAVIGLGGAGLAWWVLISILTQAGFSGNDRYLVLGAALIAIVGGVGWGWAADGIASLVQRLAGRRWSIGPAITAAVVAVCAAVFLIIPPWLGWKLPATHRALVYQAQLRTDMAKMVNALGGRSKILRCGTVMTEGFQVPALAWLLGVHTVVVQAAPLSGQPLPPAPNVIFQTRAQHKAHLLPFVGAWSGTHYRVVAHDRTFRVFANCAGGATL